MKLSWKIYSLLVLVFLGSISLALVFPPEQLARHIAAIPGGLSLIGALYQLVRDEAQYQKNLLIQKDQQNFDLGITSHMANVAFDKHIAFCEEYINEMHEAIRVLHEKGQTPILIDKANALYGIRLKYIAWMAPSIEKGLDPFERALREIGAGAQFYNSDPVGANSSGSVQNAHKLYAEVLGFKNRSEIAVEENIAIDAVWKHLRKVLGVEELTSLRHKILSTGQEQPNP